VAATRSTNNPTVANTFARLARVVTGRPAATNSQSQSSSSSSAKKESTSSNSTKKGAAQKTVKKELKDDSKALMTIAVTLALVAAAFMIYAFTRRLRNKNNF
jgi:hypothetical protein